MALRFDPKRLGPVRPRRVRGVRQARVISAVPLSPIKERAEPSDEELAAVAWVAKEGGTFPEFICYRWLLRHKFVDGVDFDFQSSQLGGRSLPGGAVVDFYFPVLLLAWRVQGLFFHIGDPSTEANDDIQKLTLSAALNLVVVDVFEDDVVERTEFTLSRAIQGIQIRPRSLGR